MEILARFNFISDNTDTAVTHIQTEMNGTYEHVVIDDWVSSYEEDFEDNINDKKSKQTQNTLLQMKTSLSCATQWEFRHMITLHLIVTIA